MDLEKLKDIFMFRSSSDDDDYSDEPQITTGSIVWGVLFRTTIVVFPSLLLINYYQRYDLWWFILVFLWFFVAWPAYNQVNHYSERIDKFEEDTLCGSCRYFDKSGQRCTILDQHVSKAHIPCEGESWEPK